MTAVNIVVVNYRSSQHVERLLRSLDENPATRGLPVTVLDNGSGFEEAERLRGICKAAASPTVVVESPVNAGFGGGANMAVRSLTADSDDVIWIVNPDVDVLQCRVDRLVQHLDQFDLVSPAIVTGSEGESVWFAGGDVHRARGKAAHRGFGDTPGPGGGVVECTFLTGAALMCTMATWRALGGFREEFFLYWEDVDLSLRAADLGLSLGVDLGERVWHLSGGSDADSSSAPSENYYYYTQRNRLLALVRGPRDVVRLLLTRGARETVTWLTVPIRAREPHALRKTAAALLGIAHGIVRRTGRR